MLKYNEWEMLNESVGTGYTLGLSNPQSLGVTGSNLKEWPVQFMDDDDDEDDDDDSGEEYNGELADDDDSDDNFSGDGDDDLEGDIMGANKDDGIMGSEEGPNSSFPPDDGDDMGEEGDDDMAALLGDIDPDLAGLGGEEGEMELGPELTGGDMGDMGGEEGLDGGDMGDMGDELGDMEMGDMEMGDELGDEMGMEEPCPECNPDGEMEEGDPACELCGGEGFVAGEDGGELDVDLEGEGGDMMGPEEDVEGEGLAMADLMHRMQDYMTRYMAPKMAANMGDHMSAGAPMDMKGGVPSMMQKEGVVGALGGAAAGGMMGGLPGAIAGGAAGHIGQNQLNRMTAPRQAKMQRKHSRKFMTKIAADNSQAGKYKALNKSGTVRRPNHPIRVKSKSFQRKFMGKDCNYCKESVGTQAETHENFLASLNNAAKGEIHQKWSSGVNEDALFQQVNPNDAFAEPQAGQPGFAPQGRVGSIGGGYTQDDFADIPTLGESRKYITLGEYIAKKESASGR